MKNKLFQFFFSGLKKISCHVALDLQLDEYASHMNLCCCMDRIFICKTLPDLQTL